MMRQSPEPYHGAKASILPVFIPCGDYVPGYRPLSTAKPAR